ncbi:hypothetical protein [Ammoniphilus sp. YIM 78166]|nr:hypothetical protein [Ammoniphilus sp. YIM 78166]
MDEFFRRRRNNKPLYYIMIGFLAFGLLLIAGGIWFVMNVQ